MRAHDVLRPSWPIRRFGATTIGLLFLCPLAATAQEDGAAREAAAEAAAPSMTISGYRGLDWGAGDTEVETQFGEPIERRELESGLRILAYRDSLAGLPSFVLFGLLDDRGLVKVQEVIDVPGNEDCIETIRTIHRQIDVSYPLIRPAEQAKNNTRDAICEAAPQGLAYWHRQWRDESTGSIITVSLASGSEQIDVIYESGSFREWVDPETDADVLEDEGAPTEVLEPSP